MHRKNYCRSSIGKNYVTFSIEKLLRNIIYSNIIVSFSAGTLSAGLSFAFGIEEWLYYGFFAMFSTLVAYNGQRFFKARENKQTPWLIWVRRHSYFMWILIVGSALIAGFCFLKIIQFKYDALLLLIFAVASSVLYVIRIGNRNAREVPYLKIHLIAFTWVFILVLFPILNENIDAPIVWISIAHYFYVVAVTIPFDIRDLKYDDPSHQTIPQVIGVFWAKINAVILLLLFTGIMLWKFPMLQTNIVFYFAVITQIILVIMMNEKRSDFYCAGWIDGAILILGLSYFYTSFL